MTTLKVHQLLQKRALVTRQSALPIAQALATANIDEIAEVVLDFTGVEAVTPSFVDEVLGVFQSSLRRTGPNPLTILVTNSPTRLSSKFSAIARARGLQIVESTAGTWRITASVSEPNA